MPTIIPTAHQESLRRRLGAWDIANAHHFISDIANRMANRIQLTTDGNRLYVRAVEEAFAGDVDFAQLVQIYGQNEAPDTCYSPAKCVGARKVQVEATRT